MSKLKSDKVLSKTLELEIKKNSYEIKFPNTGNLLDIEELKARLSGGQYNALFGGTLSSEMSRLLIDTIATFTILLPDLKKDLTVKSYLDLELVDSIELLKVYRDSYLPWYNEWMTLVSGLAAKTEEVEEDEKE